MYAGPQDERFLEHTQHQHVLYQQEQQILHQQIQVHSVPLWIMAAVTEEHPKTHINVTLDHPIELLM